MDQGQCSVACEGETGPEGPKGEQGEVGPLGQKGESGEQGVQGVAGAIGAEGPSGPIGPPGLKGESGERGLPGMQGQVGVQGQVGPPGAVGPAGPRGEVVKPSRCALKTDLADWENLSHLDEENLPYEKTTLKSGKQILLVKHAADIYQAKRICSALCGRIFRPSTSEENQQAAIFIKSVGRIWLRASDALQEGHWKDLETFEALKFTNWNSGEPNNKDSTHGGEHYAILRDDGTWNDVFYGGHNGWWGGNYELTTTKILCELPPVSLPVIYDD